MRLDIFCEDRLGLVRDLLDLLVSRQIDLHGIEVVTKGRVYLNFSELNFETFSQLMVDIRRIEGVVDVKTVAFMPTEREQQAMEVLIESLTEPVLYLDVKVKIVAANQAARTLLMGDTRSELLEQPINQFIPKFNFQRWLEEASALYSQQIQVKNSHYFMDVLPIFLTEKSEASSLVGAIVVLKNTLHPAHHSQKDNTNKEHAFDHIVAVSAKMKQVLERASKLAMMNAPLLIVGETGTGKDFLAEACHRRSSRCEQPYLALNCAALPDDVAESELFGHAAGAYPNAIEGKKGFFELANGGSVFLDEIGEMSARMQSKLLRFLNDGTFRRVGEEQQVHVDVRVICATQKNLLELVNQGIFREDLYYRLNVLTLTLPPLRERITDILPLTEHFVSKIADEQALPKPRISPVLNAFLCQYRWPGNIRQLKNCLYLALGQLESDELSPKDIILPEFSADPNLEFQSTEGSLDEICKRFERSVLVQLYHHYPSTRKLAKRLGVSHTAIANKLRDYGLVERKEKPVE